MSTLMHNRTCACPGCSAEWVSHDDGTWQNDASCFSMRFWAGSDPVPPGQKFCPVCAEMSASPIDRLAFVKGEGLQQDFLEWLIRDMHDVKDVFSALLAHEPELMETRIQEFIADEADDQFVTWRCGA